MYGFSILLLASLAAANGDSTLSQSSAPAITTEEEPAFAFQVRAEDPAQLHAVLGEFAVHFRFSQTYRDPPIVPPQTRMYELQGSDAHVTIFNPFDPHIFSFTISAVAPRAELICRTLMAALVSHGFRPEPEVDFGNPPPFCPT